MKQLSIVKQLKSEEETLAFAAQFAKAITSGATVFLEGVLGAGKTTFVRGILRGFGFQGKVKSPTYALLEPYEIDHHKLFHFDFYRINHAKELQYIGIEDYFLPEFICLVEWAEKGEDHLPMPDLLCEFIIKKNIRELTVTAKTKRGEEMLGKL